MGGRHRRGQMDSSGSPDRHRTPGTGDRAYLFSALVLIALLAIVAAPRLGGEVRFFTAGSLIDRAGGAPVPQDDLETPDLDRALVRAAALLPTTAACVVALDPWRRDYFRASYALMPRQIWPIAGDIDAVSIRRALREHAAGCLLAPAGSAVPAGLRRRTHGPLSLYLGTAPSPAR